MLLRLFVLLCLITGIALGEEKFPKWSTTKDSVIDVNWHDKNGARMYFLIHAKGYITLRTDGKEKRGMLKDKNDKMLSEFVEYIYELKKGKEKDGDITLAIQRRLDGEREYVHPRFKSYDELEKFNKYIAHFAQFVK